MPTDPGRPGYHFTAPAGWINDPLGVSWHGDAAGGRYELFYQFNPDAPVWVTACRWGQATSRDLVRWGRPRTALEPGPEETGCWSGSVVVDGGVPVIVYTSVLADSTNLGRIALATGDAAWRRWTPDPAGPVLPAPPPEAGYAHVRDPFVWRDGDAWRMALGAGRIDGRPAVLQYASTDLRHWVDDGVLIEPEPGDGPGGTVWECPQLFPLDGAWALIVSVWDGGPGDVACALGDYDGRRFTPWSWHRLAAAPCYATTAFADVRGRRCVLSWVRELGEVDSQWAGALSVPWLLARHGDRVIVGPHPDVDTLHVGVRAERGPVGLSAGPAVEVPVGRCADVVLRAYPAGRPLRLTVDAAATRLMTVTADPVADELRLTVPGQPGVLIPLRSGPDGEVDVRLLVDVGMAELFSGGAVAVARMPAYGGDAELRITGGEGAWLGHLTVHEMERLTG